MNAIDLLVRLATYNRWVNAKLYAVCAQLPDAERKCERGVFFHSLHGTLNHLLLADRLWLGRLIGKPLAAAGLGVELYGDFDELRAERGITDAELLGYVRDLPPQQLGQTLSYHSLATGNQRSCPRGVALQTLFNHQTHHRGQITALLSQLGYDYGDIDLIYMPADA